MKKIEIILGKDGSIKTEAIGFKGDGCEKATEFLKTLFEEDIVKQKSSYYEKEEVITNGLPSGWCG